MELADPLLKLPVAGLLSRWRVLNGLFIELHLACPGCSMSRFCTLNDVCVQYELSADRFLKQVKERMVYDESN